MFKYNLMTYTNVRRNNEINKYCYLKQILDILILVIYFVQNIRNLIVNNNVGSSTVVLHFRL